MIDANATVQLQRNLGYLDGDRTFAHLMILAGQIHCIEVRRIASLYTARIIVGVDRLLLLSEPTESASSPEVPQRRSTDRAGATVITEVQGEPYVGRIVAISHGLGFRTLSDVFRSLRKDVEINHMARSLSAAAFAQRSISLARNRRKDDPKGVAAQDA